MPAAVRTHDQVPRRRFRPPGGPSETTEEGGLGPWQLVERYRARIEELEHLYEAACEQRDLALLEARDFEDAWIGSAARRDALSRALSRLLKASKRFGYPPREFAARCRAHAVLTGIDPFDTQRGPRDIELARDRPDSGPRSATDQPLGSAGGTSA